MRLEDVINFYTPLTQQGSQLVGWHNRHPSTSKTSLSVDPKKQLWYCFNCGCGGNVYDWIGDVLFGENYNKYVHFPMVKDFEERGLPMAPVRFVEPAEYTPPEWDTEIYLLYHEQVQRSYWYEELGSPDLINPAIEHFKLGYCPAHPTEHCPSHTMPVFIDQKCVNIRHRLVGREKDKYRPHLKGLGAQLYNQDCLDIARQKGSVLVVAGEKKVISAWSRGIPNCISPTIGCSWKEEWTALLEGITKRYVLFDPNEDEAAEKVAAVIGARVLHLDEKLDDWFKTHSLQDFRGLFTRVDEHYWCRRLNVQLWQPA